MCTTFCYRNGFDMPTIAAFDGIKIQVFAGDHNPPHFHVVAAEFEAIVRIEDLEMVAGSLRRSDLKKALQWAVSHMEELQNAWDDLNG